MNQKTSRFQLKFSNFAKGCQRFCFMSRAKELQLEKIEIIKIFKKEASELKQEAIADGDEDSANAMLSFEEILNALSEELKMWVALKDDDANSAWDHLINAQVAIRGALQAHTLADHLEGYSARLHALELLLFPPMKFLSTGMIIENSECSICGEEYGECNHVKGRAYMGEHCVRIIKKVKQLKEVSIVDEPADKHCRVEKITDNGGTRDFLTWRIVDHPNKKAR